MIIIGAHHYAAYLLQFDPPFGEQLTNLPVSTYYLFLRHKMFFFETRIKIKILRSNEFVLFKHLDIAL